MASPAKQFYVELTATILKDAEWLADVLTGVQCAGDHTHHVLWKEFSRDTVVMQHTIGTDNIPMLSPIVEHLQSSSDTAIFVFVNTKTKTVVKSATTSIKTKTDKAGSNVDIMYIDGIANT